MEGRRDEKREREGESNRNTEKTDGGVDSVRERYSIKYLACYK